MRRVTRNGVFAVAASGALAVGMPACAAFASGGASADGSAVGSPGAVSGNTVQLPVSVPVNVCGNTVDVVGLLNPAAGNACRDDTGRSGGDAGSSSSSSGSSSGASQTASGGAVAEGAEQGSPGVLSGNGVHLPVSLPVNVSGNSVDVVGIGNPVIGNQAVNDSGDHPEKPFPEPPAPPEKPTAPDRPEGHPRPAPAPHAAPPQAVSHASLAHTGTDATLPLAGGGAALLLGGIALRRRFRPRAHD